MKLVVLAVCVVAAAAWSPGVRDECNRVNVNGGSTLLPHEKYCQLFYSCDLDGNQTPLSCPKDMLFAYGTGIATCTGGEGFSTYSCPKWSCSSPNDIGRRYPDTCCDKYYECTAVNVFSPKECSPGLRFDSVSETCSQSANCQNNKFCLDEFRNNGINDCHNSPSPTGDPCLYRSEGWDEDRQCPVGTAFDTSTCSCSQFNIGCTASGLSADVMLSNKNPDVQCRASGRMDFSNNLLNVVSDKLGRNIDHYFYKSAGFSSNSLEAVFDNSNNVIPFIYDYYYNDNTLYAPLAIVMTVRFDFNNIVLNTVYNLLENRWTTDPSNTHCDPVTLRFTARYLGINLGDRQWEFGIAARGENFVDSTGTATITGSANDYYRIVFTFGTRNSNTIGIGGSVSNRGQSGQITERTVNFNTDNRSMGSALMPNKCGFAIGRGLSGRVREFSVHEGCSTFSTLG